MFFTRCINHLATTYIFRYPPLPPPFRDEDAPATVPDPDAVKPEGWLDDEPEFVPDSTAEKPEDW